MTGHTALFPRVAAALVAALALATAALPARADDFRRDRHYAGRDHHYAYRYRPYVRPYVRPYYRWWGPRFVIRRTVVVAPQPEVVYVPTPVPAAPLAAVPASPVYQASDGRYCREYQATVTVNGVPQESYGTACMEPDGSWHIAN